MSAELEAMASQEGIGGFEEDVWAAHADALLAEMDATTAGGSYDTQ